MTYRANDSWNQHLDEMNRRRVFQPLTVELVRIEGHVRTGWKHIEHVHPYWQMEVVEAGGFSLRIERTRLYPKKGDIIFIPPQTTHHFHHPRGKRGWSFKFSVAEMTGRYPAGCMGKNESGEGEGGGGVGRQLHTALLGAAGLWRESADDNVRILIEHLIAAALEMHFGRTFPTGTESDLIRRARRHVEQRMAAGGQVKVGELAAALRCSAPYLNRVFRSSLGLPAKAFIDQYRFETARRLLLETSLNVAEIAGELGFDDAFRFSRFFKRLSGKSPRLYRNRHDVPKPATAQ
ncbi:AraC family transcriptional regulator [Geminisphaera colitermitum]|uniref:AraC family transcriptional regulator n=1 Tax=Geminisphaera colitermitum TaxID=1148786 RepID=UPI000693CF8A|nr:helix-turn-helix transcriptional regulator [Geminisphaera colitermitum]